MIDSQELFDELFQLILHTDRIIIMRAADAIEKLTVPHPDYLKRHKYALLRRSATAKEIELKWHLALIVCRLPLTRKEIGLAWQLLADWATDRNESNFVRVNAYRYFLIYRLNE